MNAFGKLVDKMLEKFRLAAGSRGYTCDACGREIFDYPEKRLCSGCLAALERNDGEKCPKCGRRTVAEGACLACKAEPPLFTRGFSPFVYRGETALLLNRLKNGERHLALFFGEKMAEKLKTEGSEKLRYVVVPVPMTEAERKKRGYNQAEALAAAVAERLDLELDKELLVKVRETLPQKRLSKKERERNLTGAYAVKRGAACKGSSFLLIDDTMTTGATGSACAEQLFRAGAEEVLLLTAAAMPEKK